MRLSAPTPTAIRQVIVDVAVLAGIGLVLALLAPLGTGAMSFAARAAYWVVLAVAGYAFYKPVGVIVLRLGGVLDLPRWSLWTAAVLIASMPMAVLVWLINGSPVPTAEGALTHYFFVAVVGAVVTLAMNLLPATRESFAASPPEPQPLAPAAHPLPRFLDRLPPHLGTDIVALEMEDHYVRTHTMLGSELVLLRMRDAVAEMDGVEGEQVHRSWWVARGAVADVRRDGRNVRLVLDNGLEAPVSRAQVAPLKEAGWL
ncbi:LytTR family DNA-binding domain-containing protein [Aurantiacibacter luteus]|uniref:HTH LytTR-type domain-containing protein n=1 Tax=Aurantiacibacter luteus TaxID=1581420 RepID=A0A0G9MXL9_9SPHN|nr:LytTR family DNA-binding domain-containing protein [Aurantiacibacter luteus]KLE34013.1 hypothetical protein AAW00_06820 [Aurantiacibacter luteus]